MKHWRLSYGKPADTWNEALPLGNGSLGAMSYGRFGNEKIELNLDSLWSGDGRDKLNKNGKTDWNYLRDLISDQRYHDAENYCREHVLGDWTESYLPAGTLHIDIKLQENASEHEYVRQLSLNHAIETITCTTKSGKYKREMFVSMADPVMAIHFQAEDHHKLHAEISLDSEIRHWDLQSPQSDLAIIGQAPIYVAPPYYSCPQPVVYEEEKGIRFALALHTEVSNGSVKRKDKKLLVDSEGDIFIFLYGATNFENQATCSELAFNCRNALKDLKYEKIKNRHLEQYHKYFNRMELLLKDTKENRMAEMMFHYARYLMICSSTPGTQCANLQGIWNHSMRPPWSSNYTVNINTEMNYWMAERCNLSEFHEPLLDLIERTAANGEKTAEKLYGLPGWVSHHNIDIWGHSSPVGYYGQDDDPCSYSMWPMSSGWLCRHLWEHYSYTLDNVFLREKAYPIIEGVVKFYLGFLVPYQDYLVTSPSTSPENMFITPDGTFHSVSMASTMDICILKELFENYLKICKILDVEGVSDDVQKAVSKLPPMKIGKTGQLQEWFFDFSEADPHHRHVSHLYGLYPGQLIKEKDHEILDACRETLNRRGDEGTGWCMAWKACLWARLRDGERALRLLKNQLRYTKEENISCVGGGIYPNLLCAHPPFQIDGNFGFAAAMMEMLLQSSDEKIIFLPALPKEWESGKIKGVKVSGGFTIDFEWEECLIKKICISAARVSEVILEYNNKKKKVSFDTDTMRHMILEE
ncbi:MAG: glycoside hydrolase family 95 protein [Blautia sp.]|nr:glycoside hydrolase family 95 protein [Blautia sp.]MDY3997619.1 glycoside hydrolase family 95 protein [Blautia sp.]